MSWDLAIACMFVTALGVASALACFRLGLPRAYAVSKGSASLGFVGTALAAGALSASWSRLAFAALVLSAAGDVALALSGRKAFFTGVALFALAHTAFTVAFAVYGTGGTTLVVTALVVALVAVGAWLRFGGGLPAAMRTPIGAYVVVISAMLSTGTAAGIAHRSVLLVCGVVLVVGSDIAVGRERFGQPRFANKAIGLPAYYLGQTLIALSLAV